MEASRPDVVLVEVAAGVVEISDDESDRLRRRLRIVGGFDSILAKFEEHAVVPVEFNLVERFRLRAAIEAWKRSGDLVSPRDCRFARCA